MAVTTKLDILPHVINIEYFKDKPLTGRSKEQGYNYFTLGYIHSINLCEVNHQEVDITAKCYKSMRKNEPPHKVNITVRKAEKSISESNCSCVAGLSRTCSHVLGLVHTLAHYQNLNLKEVPVELSCTSLPQQWHKPGGKKITPQPVVSMTLANPTKSPADRKRKPIFAQTPRETIPVASPTEILALKKDRNIPLSYLLQENSQTVSTKLGQVQTGSPLFFHLQHYSPTQFLSVTPCGNTTCPIVSDFQIDLNYKCCNELIPITYLQAIDLERKTVRQFDSEEWIAQRKKRITASIFSKVVKRKRYVNEKFLNTILNKKQFTSAATSYGTANEIKAKEKYAEKYCNNHLHDCGLVVNPTFSFLGATPDGKVCSNLETGIIEIKCPYTVRDMTIEEALDSPNFCLLKAGDKYIIKQSHDYCYQVPRPVVNYRSTIL